MTSTTFADMGLPSPILKALDARGMTHPTPIQEQAIPALCQKRDLLGIAQTGTGKTAAFLLPLLTMLDAEPAGKGERNPRALILAPSRELAMQINEECRLAARHLRLFSEVICGGVRQGPQVNALRRGLDIVIATPGRLLDLYRQNRLVLSDVSFFVVDEADQMFDRGFQNDVQVISDLLREDRQALLFSATMPESIRSLASKMLRNPVEITITPQSTPVEKIAQSVHHVKGKEKTSTLVDLLKEEAMDRVIVFTRTKHRADRLVEQLERSELSVAAIHGDKTQGARQRALRQFKQGEIKLLVATDIAARGIDVRGISHVVNYDLPLDPENYVHRIGRTARAGADGAAVSLCDETERGLLRSIERLTKVKLEVVGEEPEDTRRGDFGDRMRKQHRKGGKRFDDNRGGKRFDDNRGDRFDRKPRFNDGERRERFDGDRDNNRGPKRFDDNRGDRFDRKPRFNDGERRERFDGDRDNNRGPKRFDDNKGDRFDRKPRFNDGERRERFSGDRDKNRGGKRFDSEGRGSFSKKPFGSRDGEGRFKPKQDNQNRPRREAVVDIADYKAWDKKKRQDAKSEGDIKKRSSF